MIQSYIVSEDDYERLNSTKEDFICLVDLLIRAIYGPEETDEMYAINDVTQVGPTKYILVPVV